MVYNRETIINEILSIIELDDSKKAEISSYLDTQLSRIESNNLQEWFISSTLYSTLKNKIKKNKNNYHSIIGLINGLLKNKIDKLILEQESLKIILYKILEDYLNQAFSNYNTTTLSNNGEAYQNGTITNNVSISTEFSLKVLYTLINIDSIVNIEAPELATHNRKAENLTPIELEAIISKYWKKIKDEYADTAAIAAAKAKDEDYQKEYQKDGWTGHSHYPVMYSLPEYISTMLKYQIITAKARNKENQRVTIDPLNPFNAIDYMLMTNPSIPITEETKQVNLETVTNSNTFDINRYLIGSISSDDLDNGLNIAYASYLVAEYSLSNIIDEPKYASELQKPELQAKITPELNSLLLNNRLSSRDKYVLLTKFKPKEIKWMLESYTQSNLGSLQEFMYYCIFFKNYIQNANFTYNPEKYKNIINLFNIIKITNDIDKIASVINDWLNSIDLSTLSDEELTELDNIDHAFVHQSLSFTDRLLYEKCQKEGKPFSFKYSSFYNSHPRTISVNITDNIILPVTINRTSINQIGNNNFDEIIELFKNKYNLTPEEIPSYVFVLPTHKIITITDFFLSIGLTNLKEIPTYYTYYRKENIITLVNLYQENHKDFYQIPRLLLKKLPEIDIQFLKENPHLLINNKEFVYVAANSKRYDYLYKNRKGTSIIHDEEYLIKKWIKALKNKDASFSLYNISIIPSELNTEPRIKTRIFIDAQLDSIGLTYDDLPTLFRYIYRLGFDTMVYCDKNNINFKDLIKFIGKSDCSFKFIRLYTPESIAEVYRYFSSQKAYNRPENSDIESFYDLLDAYIEIKGLIPNYQISNNLFYINNFKISAIDKIPTEFRVPELLYLSSIETTAIYEVFSQLPEAIRNKDVFTGLVLGKLREKGFTTTTIVQENSEPTESSPSMRH